jgi:hypothetical protein
MRTSWGSPYHVHPGTHLKSLHRTALYYRFRRWTAPHCINDNGHVPAARSEGKCPSPHYFSSVSSLAPPLVVPVSPSPNARTLPANMPLWHRMCPVPKATDDGIVNSEAPGTCACPAISPFSLLISSSVTKALSTPLMLAAFLFAYMLRASPHLRHCRTSCGQRPSPRPSRRISQYSTLSLTKVTTTPLTRC